MLVLKRRVNESVFIGDNIRVTVVGMGDNSLGLGFDAPKDVPIHREEVAVKIKKGVPFKKKSSNQSAITEIENAVAANRGYNHAVDFQTAIDEIFDMSADYLTYRASYALLLSARIKNRRALYAAHTCMTQTLNKIVSLLKKAGFTPSVIAEYTTSLGASKNDSTTFAAGVVDTIEYAASALVNNTLRTLGEVRNDDNKTINQ